MPREPIPAQASGSAAGASLPGQLRRPRRLLGRDRATQAAVPYALIAPALIVIVAVLGYPIYYLFRLSFQHYGLFQLIAHKGEWVGLDNYRTILGYPIYYLVRLSFQHYGLFQLIAHKGTWVGLDNYRSVLGDSEFWTVFFRTVVFTVVNVGLTMVLGTLIALLLKELGGVMRIAVTSALVLAWSMPVVVACQVWLWMTTYENGVVNYTLTKLGFGNFINYD